MASIPDHRHPPAAASGRSMIVLARDIDFAEYERLAKEGELPRHYAQELNDRVGTQVVTLHGVRSKLVDRALGWLIGGAQQWALIRSLRSRVDGMFIYLTDETLSIPYLLFSSRKVRDARMATFIMDADSKRVQLWLRVIRRLGARPLLITDAASASAIVARCTGIDESQIAVMPIAIDNDFYSPAEQPAHRARPLIVSAGVEMRDYRTLAQAVANLDADVIVVAESSSMSASSTVELPDVYPPNFAVEKVSTRGLRDLYRQADLVVVSTKHNTIGAGASVALEGLSTGCPVIVSDTPGLADLVEAGVAVAVPVGDATSLRREVVRLLDDHDAAAALGRRGRDYVRRRHATDVFVDNLLGAFERHGITLVPGEPAR